MNIIITTKEIINQLKENGQITETIKQIIYQNIIKEKILEKGIEIDKKDLQDGADKFRVENGLESTSKTLKWLENNGLKIDDLENIIYQSIARSRLAYHLFADESQHFFLKNHLDYSHASLFEIILNRQVLAEELYYAIKEKELKFYDVAIQYIEDKELRNKGGYIGILSRKDLPPIISSAVFSAKPPQILKPIVTSKGIHLIFVEEILESQLNSNLQQEIIAHLFNNWLDKESRNVNIQVNIN
jgi:parvulin-like peptidyl-prolyl isomerase